MSNNRELDAGIAFLTSLGLGHEKNASALISARTRIVAPSVVSNVKKQLLTSGIRTPARALVPSAPRIPQVRIPGVAPIAKRAFIENIVRGAARGVDDVSRPIRTSFRDYAQGVHGGAFGNRHPVTGELIKEPMFRRTRNLFRGMAGKEKILSAKEKAIARGPDYYRGWARGKAADKNIGSSDLMTDFARTYTNADGRITAASLFDGASTSGILTSENLANAAERIKGLNPRAGGLTNGQMAAGAAGVGALGVGTGMLVSRRNKQE